MIAVLCASKYLSDRLCAAMPGGKQSALVIPPQNRGEQALAVFLRDNHIEVLLYEPSFLSDPSACRAASPHTRFVIIAAPGDEVAVHQALRRGVSAVLDKPVREEELIGVYRLVCT